MTIDLVASWDGVGVETSPTPITSFGGSEPGVYSGVLGLTDMSGGDTLVVSWVATIASIPVTIWSQEVTGPSDGLLVPPVPHHSSAEEDDSLVLWVHRVGGSAFTIDGFVYRAGAYPLAVSISQSETSVGEWWDALDPGVYCAVIDLANIGGGDEVTFSWEADDMPGGPARFAPVSVDATFGGVLLPPVATTAPLALVVEQTAGSSFWCRFVIYRLTA